MLVTNDLVAEWIAERGQVYPDLSVLYQRIIDKADHYPDTELVVDRDRLGVQIDPRVVKKPFFVDFNDYRHRLHRIQHQQWQGEFLLQSLGKSTQHQIVDATAGFGRDSFLLAAYGHTVHAFEANPLIALLLSAGLRRHYADPRVNQACDRITLQAQPAQTSIPVLPNVTGVCYLDPMFQSDKRTSVKNEKFAQVLQHLSINFAAQLTTLDALLKWATELAFSIIIIKQSAHDSASPEKMLSQCDKNYFLSQKKHGKGFILFVFTLMST